MFIFFILLFSFNKIVTFLFEGKANVLWGDKIILFFVKKVIRLTYSLSNPKLPKYVQFLSFASIKKLFTASTDLKYSLKTFNFLILFFPPPNL